MAGELGAEFLHAGGLLCVGQRAVGRKGFVRFADGDLIGQDGDTDVAQDGADMHETAQAAQGSGGGCAEGGGFAGEGGQRRFVVGFGAGDPVKGVLQGGGEAAVVFRRGDEQSIMLAEELFQGLGRGGHAIHVLQILVEDRQGEIAQGDQGDLRARLPCSCSSDGGEFLVEGIAAEAAAEGEDAGSFHGRVE